MYFVDELLDDGFLLVEKPTQLLHFFPLRLDVQLVRLLFHQRVSALLPRALLSPQPLLTPVSFEHALLKERLFRPVLYHLSAFAIEVGGDSIIPPADFEGAARLPLPLVLLQLQILLL